MMTAAEKIADWFEEEYGFEPVDCNCPSVEEARADCILCIDKILSDHEEVNYNDREAVDRVLAGLEYRVCPLAKEKQ